MDTIGLSKPVFNEGRQVLLVLDQLIIVAELRPSRMLFEQRRIVLNCLGPLPELLDCCEHVTSLIDHLKPGVEGGDECQIVGEWRCQCLHSFDDAGRPVCSISFQKRSSCNDPQFVINYPGGHCCRSMVYLHAGLLIGSPGIVGG